MGVILYGMLVGDLPFNCDSNYETANKISRGEYKIPDKIRLTLSTQCLDVINKILVIDPAKRINVNELMDHPWIKESIKINFM